MRDLPFFWNIPYLRWHLFFTLIPTIIIWTFSWKYLLRYKKTLLVIAILGFAMGFVGDTIAATVLKIWYWNSSLNLGISFFHIPIGEYTFFLLIPQELACILLLLRKHLKNG